MDIRLNDILVMKKPHPCGEKRWLVLRTGADFRLRCLGCGHELMTPRFKAEKNNISCHCFNVYNNTKEQPDNRADKKFCEESPGTQGQTA